MAIGPETYIRGGGGGSTPITSQPQPRPLTPKDFANAFLGPAGRPQGQNFSQQVINSLTVNAHGAPLSPRDSFLDILNDWAFSLPLNELWMVFFDVPGIVNNSAMSAWGENDSVKVTNTESIDLARRSFLPGNGKDSFMSTMGCAFAQSVIVPQEQNQISKIGPTNRGFLKAPVLEQRQQFGSINVEFLESNLSFTDFLIRPWVVLSSHFGYVARPDINLSTDLVVVNFAKGGTDFKFKAGGSSATQYDPNADAVNIKNERGFVARKMFIFQGCTPINIAPERISYTSEAAVDRRDTEWTFRKYQVLTPNNFGEVMDKYHSDDTANDPSEMSSAGYTEALFPSPQGRSFWTEYQERLHEDNKVRNQLFREENVERISTIPGVGGLRGRRDILSFLGI